VKLKDGRTELQVARERAAEVKAKARNMVAGTRTSFPVSLHSPITRAPVVDDCEP